MFASLDEAYERHAIAEQRLRLAGRVEDAEVHRWTCVLILGERIANEDAGKPLPPAQADCWECAAAYGVYRRVIGRGGRW